MASKFEKRLPKKISFMNSIEEFIEKLTVSYDFNFNQSLLNIMLNHGIDRLNWLSSEN